MANGGQVDNKFIIHLYLCIYVGNHDVTTWLWQQSCCTWLLSQSCATWLWHVAPVTIRCNITKNHRQSPYQY